MDVRMQLISLLVRDYDEAIEFYTKKLPFELTEDTKLNETKRWVRVKPKGNGACEILLAKATDEEQKKIIGNQSGGRVFLFLQTDNFHRDYQALLANNVNIVREPTEEPYGTVCVFSDLYGNKFDLIEYRK